MVVKKCVALSLLVVFSIGQLSAMEPGTTPTTDRQSVFSSVYNAGSRLCDCIIHRDCLQQVLQQSSAMCPLCRGLLHSDNPAPQSDQEIVYVLAEEGNGYEEIPFPLNQQS